jgi:hypothetical protein
VTNDQFAELRSLILRNSAVIDRNLDIAIDRNHEAINRNHEAINRNYEMIGRVYEEHSARFDRLEGRLPGVEDGLNRVVRRLDQSEREAADFRAEWRGALRRFESRLEAMEG